MIGYRLRRTRTRAYPLPLLGALLALILTAAPAGAAAGWTSPAQLGSVTDCRDVSAAIDENGRQHVAAACGTNVRYLTNVSGSWTTTTFSHPADRFDLEPQVAIDGNTVYVAYTRAAPATCGLDYIGVYYRWRTLPNGAWSTTTRIGRSADSLESFRVVGGVFHLTVQDTAGVGQYETTATGSLKRYVLPGSELPHRVLGAGRRRRRGARRLHHRRADPIRGLPRLRLRLADHPRHRWVRHGPAAGARCGQPGARRLEPLGAPRAAVAEDPGSTAGTYYATNRTGAWTPAASRRFTRNVGPSSLTMDPVGGQVHVVLALENAVKYYTKPATGSWSGVTISSHGASSAVIRRDPDGGRLFAAYTRLTPDFDLGGIYG